MTYVRLKPLPTPPTDLAPIPEAPAVNPKNQLLCYPVRPKLSEAEEAKAIAYPGRNPSIPIEWLPMRPENPSPPPSPIVSPLILAEGVSPKSPDTLMSPTSATSGHEADYFERLPRPALKRFPSQSYRPAPMIRAISEPYRRGQAPAVITELEWHAALQEQRRLMMQLEDYRVRFESISGQGGQGPDTQETPQASLSVKKAKLGGFRAAKAKTLAFLKLGITRFTSPKTSA